MFLLVWLCGLWQKHKLRLTWSRFVVKSVVQFPSWQRRTFSSELLGLNIYSGTLRSLVFPMNSLVYTWVSQVLVTLWAVLSINWFFMEKCKFSMASWSFRGKSRVWSLVFATLHLSLREIKVLVFSFHYFTFVTMCSVWVSSLMSNVVLCNRST